MTRKLHATAPRAQALNRSVAFHPLLLWLLAALTLILMSVPRLRAAEDLLASARTLYRSAAYDEALTTIQQLSSARGELSATDARELEEYRFLCLLALGRTGEARESMAAVVTSDPLYRLDSGANSPRIVSAFQDVRRDLLPALTSEIYADAKGAYDRKAYREAEEGFRTVLALLSDPDMQGRNADLATLVKGFMDLTTAALKQSEAPAPARAPEPAPVEVVRKPAEIKQPVTLRQSVPPVPPDVARLAGQLRAGTLEVMIDETGKVEQARFLVSIHPLYDQQVLNAARNWRYEPATADGVPIKFRKMIRVAVQAPQ